MSDWVHCNRCSARHNSQITFFLVECGHIFCHRCVEKIKSSKKCGICNKSGQVILLNKQVDQSVLDFFQPLENHLKKSLEVYKFQLQHQNTLFQNLLEKYNYAKKEYINCHNTYKNLLKENQMLRSMLRSASDNTPHRFVTSTPVSQPSDNLTLHNSSMVSSIARQRTSTPFGSARMYPGYPKRNNIFGSGSTQGPSPAQRVPLSHLRNKSLEPAVHSLEGGGTMRSLEELRRGK